MHDTKEIETGIYN